MNSVFVLDADKKPLMPCRPSRARRLLRDGKAAVYRMQPFTIILKYNVDPNPQPIEFKVDPGSKTTGMVLVGVFPQRGRLVLWAANLTHRSYIVKKRMEKRASLRRGRRYRHIRNRMYRPKRKRNLEGWLPPSLRCRVDNVRGWFNRLLDRAPISECHIEIARFDTQKLNNPEISGVQYQQGELYGYEVREYLLEKWGRNCVYCQKEGVKLEIEHMIPRSKGGSNRVSNLTISCRPCNQKKGNKTATEFGFPELMKKAKRPLDSAAAINSTRYAIGRAIKGVGLPTYFWTGGRTKFNRVSQGYPKDHWIDAACVGESGAEVKLSSQVLEIKATGRGTRQVVKTDRWGFPKGKPGTVKRILGFQTGDRVRLTQPKGKWAGIYTGILAGIRARGDFDVKTEVGKITSSWKNLILLQRGDGCDYRLRPI